MALWSLHEEFLAHVLKPSIRGRGAGCKLSGRCTTTYHEGRLRRGGVGQYFQEQGASHIFLRMLQCCLAGRCVRNIFARGRGQSGALDCRGVFALGVARAQVDALHFVIRARFGEAALASVLEGQTHFHILGEICQIASEDHMFVFLLP